MCNCNCGNITTLSTGPKGDKGDTGATGATGPAGAAGATGATGLGTLPVIDGTTANVSLTANQTGSFILFDRPTGVIATLPSAPPDGTNYTFQMAQSASGGVYVINVNGAGLDTFGGFIYMNKAATAPALFTATAGVTTQMSMNETTTGGLIGGNIQMVFYSHVWYVNGSLFGSGAVATPFS